MYSKSDEGCKYLCCKSCSICSGHEVDICTLELYCQRRSPIIFEVPGLLPGQKVVAGLGYVDMGKEYVLTAHSNCCWQLLLSV